MFKIFFCNEAHIGDHLFIKSFIKQFCELNNNIDISLILPYNKFLFSDIPNLKIISPSNDYNYISEFNGNIDPINSININNNEYIYLKNIFNQNFFDKNYLVNNNNIYIKTWIADCTHNNKNISICVLNLDCNLINCNNYYNTIINNINILYNFNIKLINNLNLLPTIPYTNIDKFLNYKEGKKIIFYYNYNPNSCQMFDYINHNNNIKNLSDKYKEYIICCAVKPNYTADNIISIENFDYLKDATCENIAKACYCAMNSDIVFSFDIGACFYYLNDIFNETFKGKWFHVSSINKYYLKLNNILNNNKVIYKNPSIETDISTYIN
jgi:hypothetical protein